MNISQIGSRYAKALYLLGVEKNTINKIYTDIQHLIKSIGESEELIIFLTNPSIKPSKKKEIIDTIFHATYSPDTLAFIHLVIKKNREKNLSDICRAFISLYRKENNISLAKITTSVKIDNSLIKSISSTIEKQINKKLEVESLVDPAILGGIMIQLDDSLYDASISKSLQKIRESLQKTEII